MDVAILAPVWLQHLEEGRQICQLHGRVALGTQSLDLFARLDGMRGDRPVDVYIYAAGAKAGGDPAVTWKGKYVGCVEATQGKHPQGDLLRPKSTETDTDWEGFWEVGDLAELGDGEHG